MGNTAVITDARAGLSQLIAVNLAQRGFRVIAVVGEEQSDVMVPEYRDLTADIRVVDRTKFLSSVDAAKIGEERLLNGPIDLYIDTTALCHRDDERTIRTHLDHDRIEECFRTYAIEPLRMATACLELIGRSDLKRVCFFSSTRASINLSGTESDYGYCMALAAMHETLSIMFNSLHPLGFTFRLLCDDPGREGSVPAADAAGIVSYFLRDRFVDSHRDDEDRFVMRDRLGREYPW
jgi:NAD(P)-dependent dehydrogenase (short-subunit alcohol dehydrogenase family)